MSSTIAPEPPSARARRLPTNNGSLGFPGWPGPGIGAAPRQPRHCRVRGNESATALDRAGQLLSAHLTSAERVTA